MSVSPPPATLVPPTSRGGLTDSCRELLIPAALGGGLLWAGFFPLNLGVLGWVALVPVLCLVRSPRGFWHVAVAGWVSGAVFFWSALSWVAVADPMMVYAWHGLAFICSLFVPAWLMLVRRLDRRGLPLVLSAPAAWTAFEYLRAHLMTGFPWYFLAHTQHATLPVIQISDLAGGYGVTFVVAAVNAAVFESVLQSRVFRALTRLPATAPRGRRAVLASVAGTLALVTATLLYGVARLSAYDPTPGPRVALLQGNLDQRLRNLTGHADDEGQKAAQAMTDHFAALADEADRQHPDLIVWPETSYPGIWSVLAPGVDESSLPTEWRRWRGDSLRLADQARGRWTAETLLGLNSTVLQPDLTEKRYNSAISIRHTTGDLRRYDKKHRVPFGEYVPFKDELPWLKQFAPYDYEYGISVGDEFTRFDVSTADGSFTYGVVICIEDTDPTLARQYVNPALGPPVDFLVNTSNDGWFDGTSEHDEHLAVCRFRAVECRRSVVRAVNMGISAVIDGNGAVTALPGPTWHGSKKVRAVLTAEVPIDHRTSLYARWGDWLPATCWVFVALAAAPWPRIRTFRPRLRPLGRS